MKKYFLWGLGGLLFIGWLIACTKRPSEKSSVTITPATVTMQPIRDIHVYLENSGSMNGYVKGNTGFEQSIYAYLTELQIRKIVDTLNLNYVNSEIIPIGNNVEKYIHNIEPADFRRHGGNLGTSDIAVVLDSVLNRHKSGDVSIFISDCIVSPGSKYASNPEGLHNYLLEQRTKMKKIFVQSLERAGGDLSVVVCQLTSVFDGQFYNKIDHPQYYKGNRPFYIWLIGSTAHIKQILDNVPLKTLKGSGADLEHVYTLVASPQKIDYRVLLTPRLGSYEPDWSEPKTSICKVRKENKGPHRGEFMFSVGVNLDLLPLSDDYVLDIANYEINQKNYSLAVKRQNLMNLSHVFSLSSTMPSRGNVVIALKNQFPQWIEDKTDFIGNDLVKDEATDKTYGLKYLMEGVFEAFKAQQEYYAEIKITIK